MGRREMPKDIQLALANWVAGKTGGDHRLDVRAAAARFFREKVDRYADEELRERFRTPEAVVRRVLGVHGSDGLIAENEETPYHQPFRLK